MNISNINIDGGIMSGFNKGRLFQILAGGPVDHLAEMEKFVTEFAFPTPSGQ
jgi:hypothetical protein